ncbi:MAG TPA: DUF2171 domain-containing protein [Sphingomicrobium sp.]|nr:DUF2171 domain-containing protein [Sphingomicrobium sp.]
MAYDRYDTRRERGYDNDRWRRDQRGGRDEDRGFFERAGDEIASWFGDDDAERRRREDDRMNRSWGRERDEDRGWTREFDRDRFTPGGWAPNRDFERERSSFGDRSRPSRQRSGRDYERMGYGGYDHDLSYRGGFGGSSNPDYMSPTGPSFGYGGTFGAGSSSGYGSGGYGSSFGSSDRERDRDRDRDRERDYRPMAGDYGRSDRSENRDSDRHYQSWRQRQLDDLDRDYDQYCRERQDRFESDFGSWRQNRQSKRQSLSGIREHMDVVGSDGESVGKVDCVKGDRIVLTKDDSPDNRHHLLDCSLIQSVEGDQVRLEVPAEEAKSRWKDAGSRGFFGRDDRDDEEMNLNRSFAGTYES